MDQLLGSILQRFNYAPIWERQREIYHEKCTTI